MKPSYLAGSSFVVAAAAFFAPTAAAAAGVVVSAVSPGGEYRAISSPACPTFSWASTHTRAVEIAVFAVRDDGSLSAEPSLREPVAAGATSWTPGADRCLPAGSYAWTLRELGGEAAWAMPRLFRVDAGAASDLDARLERAVERVIERWLREGRPLAKLHGADDVTADSALSTAPPGPPMESGAPTGTPSFIADNTAFDFPACTEDPPLFTDVENTDTICPFVKQFVADAISPGCDANRFCPDNVVTRAQLAVYLERAMRGTATWNVNADLLDGMDSTAFLPVAGGTVSGALAVNGNLTVGDSDADLVTVNGTIAGAQPFVLEGGLADDNEVVLALVGPTADHTITLPDVTGEVSLLGQTIEPAEISDVQRAVPIALSSLLDCTEAVPIDFNSGVDGSPDFSVPDGSNGLRLIWDLAAGSPDVNFVCTTFAVPPDYLSGGTLRLVSERGVSHNASWFLSWRVLAAGATFVSGNVSVPACDAGGTAGTIYLCDLALGPVAANTGVSFALGRGGANPATIYALEFVYTADQ